MITSLAGFANADPDPGSLDDLAAVGSVITSLAGFAGDGLPQAPGGRTAMPANLR